jgi:sugar phosphate isomerase/epimerase
MLVAGMSLGWSRFAAAAAAGERLADGVPNAEKLGWRVGVQVYTFKNWTLFEAIDMTASLGLKYLSTYRGQVISKEIPEKIGAGLSPDLCKAVKAKIAEAGLIHVSHFEMLSPTKCPAVFDFCKDMDIEMLVTGPKRIPTGDGSVEHFDKLAQASGVRVALTNHPKPSAYHDPAFVLEDCEGRSKMIGASIDPGHFMRGGYAPLPITKQYVEAGRLFQFDFRDVDGIGKGSKDVPLGEGIADIKGILSYVHEKKLKLLFSMEYERDFINPMAQMIPSVNYFNKVCGELLAKQAAVPAAGK